MIWSYDVIGIFSPDHETSINFIDPTNLHAALVVGIIVIIKHVLSYIFLNVGFSSNILLSAQVLVGLKFKYASGLNNTRFILPEPAPVTE
jgi:hypothetical protein